MRLPFVRQHAPHLYGSTFGKILGVGVTGTFLSAAQRSAEQWAHPGKRGLWMAHLLSPLLWKRTHPPRPLKSLPRGPESLSGALRGLWEGVSETPNYWNEGSNSEAIKGPQNRWTPEPGFAPPVPPLGPQLTHAFTSTQARKHAAQRNAVQSSARSAPPRARALSSMRGRVHTCRFWGAKRTFFGTPPHIPKNLFGLFLLSLLPCKAKITLQG